MVKKTIPDKTDEKTNKEIAETNSQSPSSNKKSNSETTLSHTKKNKKLKKTKLAKENTEPSQTIDAEVQEKKINKTDKPKVKLNKKRVIIAVLICFTIVLIIFIIALTLSLVLNKQKVCDFGFLKNDCNRECGVSYESTLVGNLTIFKWPSVVLIVFRYKTDIPFNGQIIPIDKTSMCSGTLINENTVITAASCLPVSFTYKINNTEFEMLIEPNAYYTSIPSMFTVYLGVTNKTDALNHEEITPGYSFSVSRIYLHPQFNRSQNLNNIAILKFYPKTDLTKLIQMACLPTTDLIVTSMMNTTAVGWADLNILREVNQNVNENCANSSSLMCSSTNTIDYKSACDNDLGGPLFVKQKIGNVTKNVLAGIIKESSGCSVTSNRPNYFTRVVSYLNWIQQFTNY